MKYFTLLTMLLLPTLAMAEERTILVADNNYHWSFKVENCPIDPNKRTTVIKKPSLPKDKVVIRQDGKTYRCEIKEITIVVT